MLVGSIAIVGPYEKIVGGRKREREREKEKVCLTQPKRVCVFKSCVCMREREGGWEFKRKHSKCKCIEKGRKGRIKNKKKVSTASFE